MWTLSLKERLNNVPKVTQSVSGKVRIGAQGFWLQKAGSTSSLLSRHLRCVSEL